MPKTDETFQIVEALIFASPDPIEEEQLAEIIVNIHADQIQEAVDELNREYENSDRSFRILKGAGGYRFTTLPRFGSWVKRVVYGSSRAKMSRPALETLSVIAYKQPVTRSEIEDVRGVDVSGIIRMLLERKLIAVVGRNPEGGRALQYTTTKQFLRYFGIESLDDLPQPSEMIELELDAASTGQDASELFTTNENIDGSDSAEKPIGEE